jgi:hypothetical protein
MNAKTKKLLSVLYSILVQLDNKSVHCLFVYFSTLCSSSEWYTVPEDSGIEPWTVEEFAITAKNNPHAG